MRNLASALSKPQRFTMSVSVTSFVYSSLALALIITFMKRQQAINLALVQAHEELCDSVSALNEVKAPRASSDGR